MLVPVYEKGKLVYDRPSLDEIKAYCQEEVDSLWEEYNRLDQPQLYKVDLSQELWDLKHDLLNQAKNTY